MSISNEDEEIRAVFANFGLAIYAAQCLEHGLVNALVYVTLIPLQRSQTNSTKEWEGVFDAFTSEHFTHTLGRIVKDLSSAIDVPPDLFKKLFNALTLRNWLAHNYFRERAVDFVLPERRTSMCSELQDATKTLQEADEQLSALLEQTRKKYLITQELIDKTSKEMLFESKSRYGITV